MVSGDLWQVGAVRATSVMQNPVLRQGSAVVQYVPSLFWARGADSLNEFCELTVEQRCQDPWLSYFLLGARHGQQAHETYCFAHGRVLGAVEQSTSMRPNKVQRTSTGLVSGTPARSAARLGQAASRRVATTAPQSEAADALLWDEVTCHHRWRRNSMQRHSSSIHCVRQNT